MPFNQVFFFDSGSGLGAVIGRGSGIFEVYGTGFGDGSAGVSAIMGGQPAAVLYSRPAPGFVGLQQINVQTKLGPGEFFLQLTAGGQASNSVKIQVVR